MILKNKKMSGKKIFSKKWKNSKNNMKANQESTNLY